MFVVSINVPEEMMKEEFVQFLGTNGISIFSFDSEDEFAEEFKNA